jgi:hypothetical protein
MAQKQCDEVVRTDEIGDDNKTFLACLQKYANFNIINGGEFAYFCEHLSIFG